jgi:hypothetical protein
VILFKVLTKKLEDGASQFQNFCVCFHKFHAVLYKIITISLGYHKFCERWVLKMLTGAQNAENGLGYDFFFGVKPQRW